MSVQSQINRIKGNVDKALTIISQKGVTVPANANSNNLEELIDAIGIGVVPSYWRSHLETKVTEINSALSAAGDKKSAFLWYTDAHWTSNYGQSPMILKYLSKNTGMQKTFFGGDIAVEKTGEIAVMEAWQELVKDIPNHHSVLGNHDSQTTELATAKERGDFFLMPERSGDMVFGTDATNGNNYYYIDNHIENTRYICLSTGRMWVTKDEIVWCINALNSTPKDWHIVVISHLWFNYDYTNNVIKSAPESYTQSYLSMFDDYNYRKSGTTSDQSVAYNFTNAEAKIEFVIGGHVHMDYDYTTATGIPVIMTECDGWGEREVATSATKGTITENSVYAIIADYTAKKVKVINVGRGDSRNLTIPDVIMYTNQIPISINKDGTIYNGKGYKENTRINSSDVDTTATGWETTGFIPIKIGDTVRFKNCGFLDMTGALGSSPRACFRFYDSNFAYITVSTNYSPSSLPSDAWSPVYGDDGNIVQVKIPTSYKASTAYVRITAADINANSIITINEEID